MRIIIIGGVKSPAPGNATPAVPAPPAAAVSATSPRVDSRALPGGGRELVIDHDGREYRLRLTQNGKLILTA